MAASGGPIISKEPIPFSVKLEFVFAFWFNRIVDYYEIALRVAGKKPRGRYTVKDISYSVAKTEKFTSIKEEDLPNRVYRSWGVTEYIPINDRPQDFNPEDYVEPYQGEPQLLLRDILEKALNWCGRIEIRLKVSTPEQKESLSDDRWTITPAPTVCGVGHEGLISKKWPCSIDWSKVPYPDSWDTYGIQLISRKFETKEGMDEITSILRVLTENGEDLNHDLLSGGFGAFITNQCGFHVHVEAPQDIKVLQTLAAILWIYEEEIARLHPPCRRPNHPNAHYQFESNRLGLVHNFEDMSSKASTMPKTWGFVDCSVANVKKDWSIDDIWRRLLGEGEGNRSLEELVADFNWPATKIKDADNEKGDRRRQVNFTSAVRDEKFPRTIEFRQARGTLEPEDVSRWVDFCIGLVHLAEFYSKHPERFRVQDWDPKRDNDGKLQANNINVFDLIQDMDLGPETTSYWEHRVAKYMSYTIGDEYDRLDNFVPPPRESTDLRTENSDSSSSSSSSPSGPGPDPPAGPNPHTSGSESSSSSSDEAQGGGKTKSPPKKVDRDRDNKQPNSESGKKRSNVSKSSTTRHPQIQKAALPANTSLKNAKKRHPTYAGETRGKPKKQKTSMSAPISPKTPEHDTQLMTPTAPNKRPPQLLFNPISPASPTSVARKPSVPKPPRPAKISSPTKIISPVTPKSPPRARKNSSTTKKPFSAAQKLTQRAKVSRGQRAYH